MGGWPLAVGAVLATMVSRAQTVVFDFESAPVHSPLPVSLTVGGLTARFTAVAQGYSIQEANTMGFTPAGFSGLCLYPSSVFASDLQVEFSLLIRDFSILYAPQELACDSSARMRITAYRGQTLVGTQTATADPPGTWPTGTLVFQSAQGFDRVVIHYDAPPPTGGDWGPIFMADNLTVMPGPPVLDIAPGAPGTVVLNWPAAFGGYRLEANPNLGTTGWSTVPDAVEAGPDRFQVVVATAAARQFFRLANP